MTTATAPAETQTTHVLLDVQGMHCAGCAALIENALSKLDGCDVGTGQPGGRSGICPVRSGADRSRKAGGGPHTRRI